mgnify:CR=1 FL=1
MSVTWSYSGLTKYEQCPRQYQKIYVTKETVDVGFDASNWGNRVHEALESRVRDGVALPEGMTQHEALAKTILAATGDVYVEHKFAINRAFQPVAFDSPDRWCRGIADSLIVNCLKAVALDYKTGKIREGSDQLALMALMTFAHFPSVVVCDTAFIWLQFGKTTKERFQRSDIPTIWLRFLSRVKRLEVAYEQDKWLPNPTPLCKWCPCTRSQCEFSSKP